jgi:hypothetical protein
MQDTPQTPPPAEDKGLGVIWRLAQIVLVLAAAYLYFMLGSFGGLLQRDRLFGNPHTWPLIQAALVGLGLGLCIGLALKDLSRGMMLRVDWSTLVINILAAAVFIAVAVGLNASALKNTTFITGPIKDAVVLSPLLPFVWVGLALTTIVQPKPR